MADTKKKKKKSAKPNNSNKNKDKSSSKNQQKNKKDFAKEAKGIVLIAVSLLLLMLQLNKWGIAGEYFYKATSWLFGSCATLAFIVGFVLSMINFYLLTKDEKIEIKHLLVTTFVFLLMCTAFSASAYGALTGKTVLKLYFDGTYSFNGGGIVGALIYALLSSLFGNAGAKAITLITATCIILININWEATNSFAKNFNQHMKEISKQHETDDEESEGKQVANAIKKEIISEDNSSTFSFLTRSGAKKTLEEHFEGYEGETKQPEFSFGESVGKEYPNCESTNKEFSFFEKAKNILPIKKQKPIKEEPKTRRKAVTMLDGTIVYLKEEDKTYLLREADEAINLFKESGVKKEASDNLPSLENTSRELHPTSKTAVAAKKEEKKVTRNNYIANMHNSYKLPKLNLLNPPVTKGKNHANIAEAGTKGFKALEVLRQFDVDATLAATTIGPSVTKLELKLDPNVKVSRVTSLQDNLKMHMEVKDLRIEAPIPGKNAVGLEIPNKEPSLVCMSECIKKIMDSNKPLVVPLGKDLNGEVATCNLEKMPHLLVAGATGSGKSVCINSIIVSILLRCNPENVKLLLIDPKKVEFTSYKKIPHLIGPVINDAKEASLALKAIVEIMDKRYDLFAETGSKNIGLYNKYVEDVWNDVKPDATEEEKGRLPKKMPYIVVIIDELADLMLVAGKEVEASIQRITQLARAAGIHLIVATQRPSSDVITGVIKANIPSRIAFAVSNSIDSRVILDQVGAERLLGYGDMLYSPIGANAPMRVQGTFVDDEEIGRITEDVSSKAVPVYDDIFLGLNEQGSQDSRFGADVKSDDPLYDEAMCFVVETGKASTSLLQRHFGIGYSRAARLCDILEARGVIGSSQGSKPREILISKEELNKFK